MKDDSANLDVLRTLAVSMVVASHLCVLHGWRPAAFDVEVFGRAGVAIFFVHTSLVLMLSLERHGAAALPFLIRRVFRIYPLAVAVVLLSQFILWREGAAMDWATLASNLLLIQNLTGAPSWPAPLWSLPYELQMYLVLPALYALTITPGGIRWVGALWLAAVVTIGLAMLLHVPHQLVQYVPCFLAGVIAFGLRGLRRVSSPAVLFAAVAWLAAFVPAAAALGAPETPLFWLLSIVLGLLLPVTSEIGPGLLAVKAKEVVTYSFGIYLTHLLAEGGSFVAFHDWPWWYQWTMFFAELTVLSYAGYVWLERRGIELGKRFADRISAVPVPPFTTSVR